MIDRETIRVIARVIERQEALDAAGLKARSIRISVLIDDRRFEEEQLARADERRCHSRLIRRTVEERVDRELEFGISVARVRCEIETVVD